MNGLVRQQIEIGLLKERFLIVNLTSKSRSTSTVKICYLVKACSSIVARVRPAIVPISFTMFSCIPVFAIAFIFCGTISNEKRVTVFYNHDKEVIHFSKMVSYSQLTHSCPRDKLRCHRDWLYMDYRLLKAQRHQAQRILLLPEIALTATSIL